MLSFFKKYSTKSTQNLLFFTRRMLALPQQSATYGLLCTSTQWHKRMAKKQEIMVEFFFFQWKK